jgi:ribonuclease P protein component
VIFASDMAASAIGPVRRHSIFVEFSRETHLSALKTRAQAPAWFSRPHGDPRRTQSRRRAARAGSQEALGLTIETGGLFRMAIREEPRQSAPIGRLKRSAEFQRLRRGKRLKAQFGELRGIARTQGCAPTPSLRVGLIVPKRLGNAPRRNRIKRRLREALRRAQSLDLFEINATDNVGIDIGVLPSQGAAQLEFQTLVEQLGSASSALMRRLRRLPI